MRSKVAVVVGCCLLFFAVSAAAQTAVNPVTLVFSPSADHDAISPLDGSVVLVRYEMRVWTESNPTGTPLLVTDLGKPTPVSNTITITNAVWFSGLTPNTKYIAKVVAIGPSGEGVSDPSNPFGNAPSPQKPGVPTVRK